MGICALCYKLLLLLLLSKWDYSDGRDVFFSCNVLDSYNLFSKQDSILT